eukprot:GEMP01020225.1.p1 GENE.GEMP01020225.1~~GEMP01020225.1.p1  ORF type:complete len:449 (+),score=64.63 GEMP01020225.1:143-1489(+)
MISRYILMTAALLASAQDIVAEIDTIVVEKSGEDRRKLLEASVSSVKLVVGMIPWETVANALSLPVKKVTATANKLLRLLQQAESAVEGDCTSRGKIVTTATELIKILSSFSDAPPRRLQQPVGPVPENLPPESRKLLSDTNTTAAKPATSNQAATSNRKTGINEKQPAAPVNTATPRVVVRSLHTVLRRLGPLQHYIAMGAPLLTSFLDSYCKDPAPAQAPVPPVPAGPEQAPVPAEPKSPAVPESTSVPAGPEPAEPAPASTSASEDKSNDSNNVANMIIIASIIVVAIAVVIACIWFCYHEKTKIGNNARRVDQPNPNTSQPSRNSKISTQSEQIQSSRHSHTAGRKFTKSARIRSSTYSLDQSTPTPPDPNMPSNGQQGWWSNAEWESWNQSTPGPLSQGRPSKAKSGKKAGRESSKASIGSKSTHQDKKNKKTRENKKKSPIE